MPPALLRILTGARRTALAACLMGGVIAGCAIAPAQAQFGTIFGDPPPRPPANVPTRPQAQDFPDQQFPQQPAPQRRQDAPQRIGPGRPPSQAIQSEPLAPPPGSGSVPEIAREPAQPGAPGRLPPGVRQPRGTPQPSNTAPQPGDEIIAEPPAQKIENQLAVFSGLDKITGRITSFDVSIGETVQFGALQVVPRACYTRPPTETPNTDAFIEVSEVTLQGEVRRIFAGWMFASSPGLHAVEHPIYDIWLTDCKQPLTKVAEDPPIPAPAQQTAPAPRPPRAAPPQGATPQQRAPRPAPPSSLERAFPAPIR